ncbi:GNAT family protein [Agrobacterium sp. ST15.13.015]|uniref:GNAT family protein n=1 Tax=Agrobacterium sp. ST15.13.015 TaxID=3017319 RepID=UPI0022CCEF94|nr:GNAT family protein [Agrobacterium sp. ST15.13.015]MCZ7502036.1 GNAT family protein [Rhizobium rhizogenes]
MNILWGGSSSPEVNEPLGDWCSAQIFGQPGQLTGPYSTMGVLDGDGLIAVMLFNNYHPQEGVIEIHGAATDKRWLNRITLKAMFSFPFEQLGCQLVVMRVSERNGMWNGRGIHRFLKAYGFKDYRIPRLRGRDEDEIIYTLTDDDWRANGFHKG